MTPTQKNIFERLKISNSDIYEGAVFFVLSKEEKSTSIAKLEIVDGDYLGLNDLNIKVLESKYKTSFSASAFLFDEVVSRVEKAAKESFVVINDKVRNESFRLKISKL